MAFGRFEDVPVWNDGARLYAGVESLVEDKAFAYHGDPRSQLLRAVPTL